MKLVLQEHSAHASSTELGQDLTVIVPYYQEAETLHHVAMTILKELPELHQLIVVDDGSTVHPAGSLPTDPRILHLRHSSNRGKGAALRTAFTFVDSKYVALHDADLEYDPADISKMLHILRVTRSGAVIGTRRCAPGWATARLSNRLGNLVLTWFFNCVRGSPFTDVTAGTKVFERDAFDFSQLREDRWGTDVEILAWLAQSGPVIEVPISYKPRTLTEGKKIRSWHALQILRSIWATRVATGLTGSRHQTGASTGDRKSVPGYGIDMRWRLIIGS